MKAFRVCSVAALLLSAISAFSPLAAGSIVDFQFDATLSTGLYSPISFIGSGSHNNAGITGVGIEDAPLTSFDFGFVGTAVTLANVTGLSNVVLDDGALSYMTVGVIDSSAFSFVFGYFNEPFSVADSLSPPGTIHEVQGTGTYSIVSSSATPEPSAFVLCTIAFFLFQRLVKRSRIE